MIQRNALIISAALTAFILVFVGGIIGYLGQAAAAPAPAVVVTVTPPAAADAPVAQQQPTAAPTASPTDAPTDAPPTYAVSPEQAATLAQQAAPGAQLQGTPDLVDFQGAVAYEVTFDRGKVYVDANSGAILYNGAATQRRGFVTADQAAEIARQYRGGGTVIDVQFGELGDDVRAYQVTFSDGVQVYVEARTGRVITQPGAPGQQNEGAGQGL